jgi:hypothetical protein
MGADGLLQTFDAKLVAFSGLDLDDAIGVEQQAIARRKFRFRSLKLSVRNDPYRRPCGISANDRALHFTGTSARVQRRWVSGTTENVHCPSCYRSRSTASLRRHDFVTVRSLPDQFCLGSTRVSRVGERVLVIENFSCTPNCSSDSN